MIYQGIECEKYIKFDESIRTIRINGDIFRIQNTN